MLKRIGLLLFALALLVAGLTTGTGQESAFIRMPYLGLTGDPSTTVVVSWKTTEPLAGVVHYAPLQDYETNESFTAEVALPADAGGENYTYHAVLSELAPETAYAYQVELRDAAGMTIEESPVGQFITATADLDHFTFAVYGDTRTYPERHRMVAEAMAADEPRLRFVVHVGDMVENGGVMEQWDERFFPAVAGLARDIPLLTVLGNHERNADEYYEAFPLPPGGGDHDKEWWSLDYGVVHLVGLDSNALELPRGFKRMREQVAWLKEDLARAREHARFIFVFFHHPLFSSNRHYWPGNTGLRQLWHPIFVENGVDAVFTGHVHSYERLIEDGVNYIVTGGGGAPLGGYGEESVPGSVIRIGYTLHYVRVTIDGDRAVLEMVPVATVSDDQVVPLAEEPLDTLVIED